MDGSDQFPGCHFLFQNDDGVIHAVDVQRLLVLKAAGVKDFPADSQAFFSGLQRKFHNVFLLFFV